MVLKKPMKNAFYIHVLLSTHSVVNKIRRLTHVKRIGSAFYIVLWEWNSKICDTNTHGLDSGKFFSHGLLEVNFFHIFLQGYLPSDATHASTLSQLS